MKRKSNLVLLTVFLIAILGFCNSAFANSTWTTIPIQPCGISGSNVAGIVWGDPSIYNLITETKTILLHPDGANVHITAIDGSNIVGYSWVGYNPQQSFLYNGVDWETLDLPTDSPSGIDGDNIVGGNWVYNMTTRIATYFTYPGTNGISIFDIDGDNLVGGYVGDTGRFRGFLYNGTSWIDLDPELPGLTPTLLYGISGDYAVGLGVDAFNKNHGLLYNITTQSWTVLDYPGAIETSPTGIDGNKIVGTYEIGTKGYGFLYTISEPTTIPTPTAILLAGIGATCVNWLSRRKAI